MTTELTKDITELFSHASAEEIREMQAQQEGSVRSLEMARRMYFEYVDQLLDEMGYTGKPVEEKKEDLIDVLKSVFSKKK